MHFDKMVAGLGAALLFTATAAAAPPVDTPLASSSAPPELRDPLPPEPSHPYRGRGPAIVAGFGYGLIGLGAISIAGAAAVQYEGARSYCDACLYQVITAGLAAHGGACLISGIVMAVVGNRKAPPVALAPLVLRPLRIGAAHDAPPAGATVSVAF